MKRILSLFALLLVTIVGMAQAPSNYTNINGRYRWIAGMFDSTFSIPKGTTPSLRTGGSSNPGAMFYRTTDSSLYLYTGTQWLKQAGASGFVPYTGATQNVDLGIYGLSSKFSSIADTGGIALDVQQRTSLTTDVALNIKTTGYEGFAALIDQADSVAAGTQYNTIFRKSMMPGTGNPANGGGVSWYTQIGNDAGTFRSLSVYRARITDSTGFAGTSIKGSSTEFWTRKNNAWDTTLVLNQGNVGINTGQNGIDSALTVANGTWLKGGVRMSALPTGVGTKALRIDANGTISTADTLIDAGGTVTSVATNTGTGITGGTITTTGTLAIDTLLISTRAWRQKGIDSVISVMGSRVSGTTNYIPKFTSSSAIGNSLLYDNGTTVSINTTTTNSNEKLRVDGGRVAIFGNSEVYQLKLAYNNATAGFWFGSPSANALSFYNDAGTERMRIDASGSVGIGTSSPSQKLSIYGGNLLVNNGVSPDANSGIRIVAPISTTQYNWMIAAQQNVNNGFEITPSTAVGGTTFSTPALVISSTGNVSIGNTNNTYKLDVSGTSRISTSSGENLILDKSSGAYLSFYNGSTLRASINGFSGADGLNFNTGASHTTRMILDASGNLGLGVTPSAWSLLKAIQVNNASLAGYSSDNSAMYLSANTFFDGTNFTYISTAYANQYRQQAGQHIWYNAPSGTAGNAISFTQAMTLDASGRLGIGTTSPASVLNVAGTSANTDFRISRTVNASAYFSVTAPGGTPNASIIGISGTDVMTLNSSGNVGIGTTSPAAKLDIVSNTAQTSADVIQKISYGTIGSSAVNKTAISISAITASSTDIANSIRQFETGDISLTASAGRYVYGSYYGIKLGTLSTNGVSGIPTSHYHVNLGNMTGSSDESMYGIYIGTIAGGAGSYGVHSNVASGTNRWNFYAAGTANNYMAGSLGIGTTSPAAQLDIINGASGFRFFTSTSTQAQMNLLADLGSGLDNAASILGVKESTNNAYLSFGTKTAGSLTEKMRITSGGNVGIGTINPQTAGGSYTGLDIRGSTGSSLVFGSTSTLFSYLYADAGALTLETTSSIPVKFSPGGSERMRITSGGELLINTTSAVAGYKLQVNGSTYTNGSLTTATVNGNNPAWKLGAYGTAISGSNGYAVAVDIGGTVYYLMTAALPEPEPEPQAGPSMGYKQGFEEPIIKLKTESQEIKELKKQIEELRQLIKNK